MGSADHHHPAAEAAHNIPRETLRRVEAWVPDDFAWRVAWRADHDGRWFALAVDFDIIGRGSTPEAAEQELFELLGAYLATFLDQGKPFTEAVRPVPRHLRVRIHAATVIFHAVDRLTKRPERRQERSYGPADLSPVAAAALA